jgi:hypothetical protein
MATEKDPPLYLHVTAMTQEALDLALQKIDELINEAQNPAPLPPQRDSFAPPSRMPGGPPLVSYTWMLKRLTHKVAIV